MKVAYVQKIIYCIKQPCKYNDLNTTVKDLNEYEAAAFSQAGQ